MNFTQLRCFIKAVDNSSFTLAARELNFTQPAISKNIRDLENELEITLIIREHHRITLTKAGRYFYKIARNMVDDMDNTTEFLKSQKGRIGSSLRIGVCEIPLEEEVLPAVLRKLRAYDSNLDIQFINVEETTISEILNHHVDICLVSYDTVAAIQNIQFVKLITGKFLVACPVNSALSKQQMITLSDLQKQRVFLFDPNSTLNFKTQNDLISGIGVKHIKFVRDFFKMKLYVKAGWGYGVIPNFAKDYDKTAIKYVPLDYPAISPYGIAYINSSVQDMDVAKVINTFKRVCVHVLE